MSRRSRREARQRQPELAPVELPHVLVVVTEDGSLDVTVDGAPSPPPAGRAWTRVEFGSLLDQVTQDRTVPMRIEVRETDGSVFTDILRPRRSTTTAATLGTAEGWPVQRRGRHAKDKLRPVPVEVTADGLAPGEQVAVAVVLAHTRATSTGDMAVLLDPGLLSATRTGDGIEVLVHGRVSGTTQGRRLR